MENQAIVCQNCGKALVRWTEDGAVAFWPDIMNNAREIDADHTEIVFECPDCGCRVTVKP